MNTLAKITKQLGFIFITLLVVSACKGIKIADVKNKDTTTTLLINHYKVECDAKFKRDLCLQIKKKRTSGSWEKYAGDIKSFTYDWGYDYEIEVTSKTISPKPDHAPDIEYTFKKTVSKVKTPDTSLFVLTVSRNKTADAIKKPNKDKPIYRIYNEINFKCDPTENRGKSECDFIQSHINQDDAFKFTMMHDKGALKTSGLPCVSARSSFKTDCK